MDITLEDVTRTLKRIHDLVEPDTEDHAVRVGALAYEIGCRINGRYRKLSEDRLAILRMAAEVHDFGKVGVDSLILNKPTQLNRSQREAVQTHTQSGFDALEFLPLPNEFGFAVLYHHEHYDGSGYPRGLKGREIPLFARIVCLADVWDAITSDRVYRHAMPKDKALRFMDAHQTWFEPRLYAIFLEVIKERK